MSDARLLLIEDDGADAESLRSALAEVAAGIAIDHAHDAVAALQMLAQRERSGALPPPDALIVDVYLPGLDGDELLRVLKASTGWSRIPVIALSVSADPTTCRRCIAAGALACLRKPADRAGYVALARRLAAAVADRDAIDQRLAQLAGWRTDAPGEP